MSEMFAYSSKSDIPALIIEDITYQPHVLDRIFELNRQLVKTDEAIEGNVCYFDGQLPSDYVAAKPSNDVNLVIKRLNLVALARRRRSMLEIGVNGGHSALICLSANPTLHFYGVDICAHRYTHEAVAFLKNTFGRRFHFWSGDSREVMPRLFIDRPRLKFDLLHIDGGHSPDLAIADMSNAIRMAEPGADLILDDVNYPPLGSAVEHLSSHGHLAPLLDHRNLRETELHQILRVV